MSFNLQGVKPNHDNHIPLSAFQLMRRTGTNPAKIKLEPVQRVRCWSPVRQFETALTKHALPGPSLRSRRHCDLKRRESYRSGPPNFTLGMRHEFKFGMRHTRPRLVTVALQPARVALAPFLALSMRPELAAFCGVLQGKGSANRIWKLRLPPKDASERPRWLATLCQHGVQGAGTSAPKPGGSDNTVAPNGYNCTLHPAIWEGCRTEVCLSVGVPLLTSRDAPVCGCSLGVRDLLRSICNIRVTVPTAATLILFLLLCNSTPPTSCVCCRPGCPTSITSPLDKASGSCRLQTTQLRHCRRARPASRLLGQGQIRSRRWRAALEPCLRL